MMIYVNFLDPYHCELFDKHISYVNPVTKYDYLEKNISDMLFNIEIGTIHAFVCCDEFIASRIDLNEDLISDLTLENIRKFPNITQTYISQT